MEIQQVSNCLILGRHADLTVQKYKVLIDLEKSMNRYLTGKHIYLIGRNTKCDRFGKLLLDLEKCRKKLGNFDLFTLIYPSSKYIYTNIPNMNVCLDLSWIMCSGPYRYCCYSCPCLLVYCAAIYTRPCLLFRCFLCCYLHQRMFASLGGLL